VHIWRMVVKAQEIIFGAHDETHCEEVNASAIFFSNHPPRRIVSPPLVFCSPLSLFPTPGEEEDGGGGTKQERMKYGCG
ncbi:hypothetical protein CHARACLAT_007515, partial [Characodon lateralis]|nr:hypothetical protein [Characodon lateralis]